MAGQDPTGEATVERLPPEEAFELVADETRLGTLRVLNAADGPVAFGELRRRVGVDDPGRFNYHLQRLVGRYVRDAGDGYELSRSGLRVVGAVLSGGYTGAVDADPVPVDAPCLQCGGALETRFHEDKVTVACRDCGVRFGYAALPPAAVEGRPLAAVPAVVDRWFKRTLVAADCGFCHRCEGALDRTVRRAGADGLPARLDDLDLEVVLHRECRRCGGEWFLLVGAALLVRPAVVAFHHEHGVDVWAEPHWGLDWLRVGIATVASADPLRVEVPVTLDDETLLLAVDADLEVVAERRTRAG